MSIAQRKHNRLTVDIPVFRFTQDGERIDTLLYQIGIGGCLVAWEEGISKGDRFRMEMQLPNGNWLPLSCKVLYSFEDDAIGIQFMEITQFEQDLLVEIMSNKLTREGIPFDFDPFSQPGSFVEAVESSEESGEVPGNGDSENHENVLAFEPPG